MLHREKQREYLGFQYSDINNLLQLLVVIGGGIVGVMCIGYNGMIIENCSHRSLLLGALYI